MSAEEYKKLTHAFYDKVLIRSDVYLQSSPEELQRFRGFLAEKDGFHWVIDGLNAAFKIKPRSGRVPKALQAATVRNTHRMLLQPICFYVI